MSAASGPGLCGHQLSPLSPGSRHKTRTAERPQDFSALGQTRACTENCTAPALTSGDVGAAHTVQVIGCVQLGGPQARPLQGEAWYPRAQKARLSCPPRSCVGTQPRLVPGPHTLRAALLAPSKYLS